MKTFIVLLMTLCSLTGFSQAFHVTIDGGTYLDGKDKATLSIDKGKLMSSEGLSVVPATAGRVGSFDMSHLPKRGEYRGPVASSSAAMTKEMKKYIAACNYGDKVFFESIKVRLSNGSVVDAKPILAEVK